MAEQWYQEIIDCRGRGAKTDKGAAFSSEYYARKSFDSFRSLDVPGERAEFLLDLHDGAGDLVDTIRLDSSGFKMVTGESPKVATEYERIDREYWSAAMSERA
jgi:hypothetical protein